MRVATILARLFVGACVALLIALLPQGEIAQAASAPLMPASCNGTATGGACAHREPGLSRFAFSLRGTSGTISLFGVCPVSRPQTIGLSPFTVVSYNNQAQCQITLVDNHGIHHPIQFGRGVFPGGLVVVRVIIYPVGFSGQS